MLLDLAGDQSAEGRARLHYFLINKGPWSRLDHNAAVRSGRAAETGRRQLLSRRMRPRRRSKLDQIPAGGRAGKRQGLLHRGPPRGGQKFTLVPYNIEYQGELTRAAALLREAAAAATEPTLKKFLTTRADAFLTNDYYASDVAWMELNGAIEPTIGPYEVYEDDGSTTRRPSKPSSPCRTKRKRRSCRNSRASCRTSRTICRSIRNIATPSSARSPRSWW